MTTQVGWGWTVIGACQAADVEAFCGPSVDVSSGNTKRCRFFNSSPQRVRSFMSTKDGSPMTIVVYNCTGRSELREKEGKKKEGTKEKIL